MSTTKTKSGQQNQKDQQHHQQKNQQQKTKQQGSAKMSKSAGQYQEHEHPESRMTD